MSRSFDAGSLIILPRLDAPGAVALGSALGAAAKGKQVAKPVHASLLALEHATATLESALSGRNAPEQPGVDRNAADVEEDAAWSALHGWLEGWSRVPRASQAGDAAGLLESVFPDGLSFTLLRYPVEWAEADARLKQLDGKGAATIAALGGQPLLDALRAAHERYGKAIGVTAAATPPAPGVDLRTPLDAFAAAARRYVLKVAGAVDESDADSVALGDALLAPLAEWPSKSAGGHADAPPAEEPALPAVKSPPDAAAAAPDGPGQAAS